MTVENGVLKKASFSTCAIQREALMVAEIPGERYDPYEMVESILNKARSSDFHEVIECALKNCTYGDLKKVSWFIVKVWFYWTLREKDPHLRNEYLSEMKTISDAFNPDSFNPDTFEFDKGME
jgi:hypothetical protein